LANIINGTDTGSGGLITTGDSSDELQLQTAEVARVTLTNTAVVVNESGADVDFRVEGDTEANLLFVDASADKIGIGTNAPSEVLHLKSATADKPVILLENTTSNDTTTGNAPSIRFYSNDSNQAGIPDNAELGIIEFRGDDKDGGSDRNYAQIKGLAADPGGTYKGAITFSTSSGAVPAERGRFDSDGLKFNGDTAAANALDDYEEGTWTPNITSSGGGSGSGTDKAGTYTKIGRMVYASGYHVLTNKTGINAGQVRVEGLPFNAAALWVGGVTFNTLNSIVQTGVQTNGGISSNFISLANVLNNGTQTAINVTELTNTSGIYFSVFYQV
jgi:hypothetical protein